MTAILGQSVKGHGYTGYEQTRAYDCDHGLTEVGPGSVGGKFFRSYKHSVVMSSEVGEPPREIRLPGENLVLFRTNGGGTGMIHKHCLRRLASLVDVRCEENGIRCRYRGWLFATDGRILESPGKATGPGPAVDARAGKRIGAYPMTEYPGLVFPYIGPVDRMPDFPFYDAFETPGITMRPYRADYSCNWLQVLVAIMEPVHITFLRSLNGGTQFSEMMKEIGKLQIFERGQQSPGSNTRCAGDFAWVRIDGLVPPNFTQAGSAFAADGTRERYFGRSSFTCWVIPFDNHDSMIMARANFGDRGDSHEYNGREGCELSEQGEILDRSFEERQCRSADEKAVEGIGLINARKGENLIPTDRGVSLYRRRIRKRVRNLISDEVPLWSQQIPEQDISTYGQDTILRLSLKNGDDRKFGRTLSGTVLEMQFAAENMPQAERHAYIVAQLRRME